MNYQEMIKQLKKEKKMLRESWDDKAHIFLEKCGCCITQIGHDGRDMGDCIFSIEDIEAKDWMEKKK